MILSEPEHERTSVTWMLLDHFCIKHMTFRGTHELNVMSSGMSSAVAFFLYAQGYGDWAHAPAANVQC